MKQVFNPFLPLDEYIPDGEPDEPAKHESRFGPLKFGREFDLKRNDGKRRR